jgi:hypothetical protein
MCIRPSSLIFMHMPIFKLESLLHPERAFKPAQDRFPHG